MEITKIKDECKKEIKETKDECKKDINQMQQQLVQDSMKWEKTLKENQEDKESQKIITTALNARIQTKEQEIKQLKREMAQKQKVIDIMRDNNGNHITNTKTMQNQPPSPPTTIIAQCPAEKTPSAQILAIEQVEKNEMNQMECDEIDNNDDNNDNKMKQLQEQTDESTNNLMHKDNDKIRQDPFFGITVDATSKKLHQLSSSVKQYIGDEKQFTTLEYNECTLYHPLTQIITNITDPKTTELLKVCNPSGIGTNRYIKVLAINATQANSSIDP